MQELRQARAVKSTGEETSPGRLIQRDDHTIALKRGSLQRHDVIVSLNASLRRGYYRDDDTKALYDNVTDEDLFGMCIRRQVRRELPRPSTFLRTKKIKWPGKRSLTASAKKILTKISATFKDSLDN